MAVPEKFRIAGNTSHSCVSTPRCSASRRNHNPVRSLSPGRFEVAPGGLRWNNCVHNSYHYVHRLLQPFAYRYGDNPWRAPQFRTLRVALPPGARAKPQSIDEARSHWRDAFRRVRAETEKRAAHLSAEDQIVQSMADASPTKWHRAHVTWFFEQFLLVPNDPTYKIFDERFPFLFNSYYVAAGPRHARPQRGLITRPNSEDVAGYRAHVDAAVERLIEQVPAADAERVFAILEIGLHHEQQHQELLLTDILHAFAQNPTDPVYDAGWQPPRADARSARFCRCAGRHSRHRPRGAGLLLRQRDAAA